MVIGDAYLVGDDGGVLRSFFVGGDGVEIMLARGQQIALHFRRELNLRQHAQAGGPRSPGQARRLIGTGQPA